MVEESALLTFADQVGRHFARQWGVSPITGRVAGWLMVCDPPQQTATEIGAGLRASRSAVGTAIATLETWAIVQRSRAAGERADRISIDPAFGMRQLEAPTEYASLGLLARHGLEMLKDEPAPQRARLVELAAMAEFLVERLPALAAEWEQRRDALRASGELPGEPGDDTRLPGGNVVPGLFRPAS